MLSMFQAKAGTPVQVQRADTAVADAIRAKVKKDPEGVRAAAAAASARQDPAHAGRSLPNSRPGERGQQAGGRGSAHNGRPNSRPQSREQMQARAEAAARAREAAAAAERGSKKKARVSAGVTRDDVKFDLRARRAAGVPTPGVTGGRASRSNGLHVKLLATPKPTGGRHPPTRRVTRGRQSRSHDDLKRGCYSENAETHPRISARGASTCGTGSLRAHLRRGAGSARFLESSCAASGSSRGK